MPPEDPREKRGRDGLWKVPPPWEPAAKPARSHRGLEAFGFHTFHSPDGGLTYKPLTQGVGPFYSIGVGSFYVVKARRTRFDGLDCSSLVVGMPVEVEVELHEGQLVAVEIERD